jgi:hypothetical protein
MIDSGKRVVVFLDSGADGADAVDFIMPEFQMVRVCLRFCYMDVGCMRACVGVGNWGRPGAVVAVSRAGAVQRYALAHRLAVCRVRCCLAPPVRPSAPFSFSLLASPCPRSSVLTPPQIWEAPFSSTDPTFPCKIDRIAGPLADIDHM